MAGRTLGHAAAASAVVGRLCASGRSNPAPPLPLDGPTEVRDLTARFNAMTAEIANTRREEADLLANLRHDLRTPVTVISGFAAALTDGTATGDDIPRAARAIGEEAARLEDLVGQLGAFERLESADPGLRPEPLNAADIVAQTAERFRTSAAAAGVDVVATVADPTLTLTADRSAVDRILGNLVGNALAALQAPSSRPGAPVTSGSPRRPVPATPAGDAVALEVTDDGPGFPPGAVGRVFERFYRADPSRARSASGTPGNPGAADSSASSGLGLAIVRDLARAHGGEAFAENVAPHGARVSVVLPLHPAGRRPQLAPDRSPDGSAAETATGTHPDGASRRTRARGASGCRSPRRAAIATTSATIPSARRIEAPEMAATASARPTCCQMPPSVWHLRRRQQEPEPQAGEQAADVRRVVDAAGDPGNPKQRG